MAHKKSDLNNLSLAELKKEIKRQHQREREIEDIKHEGKKLFFSILFSPLTVMLFIAFFLVWFYFGDAKQALAVSSTYLLEFFILRHFDKKR
jgi:hypothetical protein